VSITGWSRLCRIPRAGPVRQAARSPAAQTGRLA
jgi:hypothetical protein